MIVDWTQNAKRELRGIHDYIAQNSPRYALGMVDRITRKTEILARFPELGAEVPEYEDEAVRELFKHPYRIIYRVRGGRVQILSVVHGARELPPNVPQDG
jgi:toxin ParE1/3/4